ncbi:kinetochore protein NDC80 homolog [Anneissia japonica]|uniref:kinetochore protein NDC80 homolog n=1 Tax=Anneissia japonica TaxID=1529436 RepID=UPI0014254C26|nr:kinetochore protein NDC80 homolog [Anneissia japonica]
MHRNRSSSGSRASLGPLRIKQDSAGVRGRSLAGGRLSTGANSRTANGRSSIGGSKKSMIPKPSIGGLNKRRSSNYGRQTYGHEVLKDPRPISDKSFMHREIKEIVEFLIDKRYPSPVTTKSLITPTTKDFLRIFQFVYAFLEPKFVMPAKHEEELPKIMKTLGYPFNISKSSLYTIGSPHTWPHLLAALHWLMELVKCGMSMRPEAMLYGCGDDIADEFDGKTEAQVLYEFVESTYDAFLGGADTYEVEEQAVAKDFRRKVLCVAGDIQQLEAEKQRLTAELQLLENEPCQLTALQERFQVMQIDNNRFKNYLVELENHKRAQEQKLAEVDCKYQQEALAYEQTIAENKRLKHIFDTQELSAADVERIKMQQRELAQTLESLEKEKEAFDREIWQEEKAIAKEREQIEHQAQSYNNMARKLKLIPTTAENSHGIDYELRLNFVSQHPDHASMMNFANMIKPALVQLKKQVKETVHDINSQKDIEMEALEQILEMVESKQEEISLLETKLERAEREFISHKERLNKEYKSSIEQVHVLEAEVLELKQLSETDVEIQARDLEEMKRKAQQELVRMKEEKHQFNVFLIDVVNEILQHKTIIQEHISGLHTKAQEELKSLQQ